MTFSHVLFVLLLCVLTGSYTWGMRGTIIGGERGAMLPGSALAMVLLFAGGSAPVSAAFPMAASIGAAGMFFGGSQTYGDTISLTHDADLKIRMQGRIGLAVKGAGWFGVFGGIMGFGLGALAGRYEVWEAELFVILLPVARALGILLLNSPHKPKEKKFPKLYFSKTRRETWGGMVLVVFYIILFSLFKHEWFSVWMTVFGVVFGGAGFFAGNLLQTYADQNLSKTWISGWKAMECTFGAIGGLGVGLCWCLLYAPFGSRYTFEITAHSGVWRPLPEKPNNLLLFVWLLLLALFIARYWVKQPRGRKGSNLAKILYDDEDLFIWPVFCIVPLLWASLGNLIFAQVFSFFGIFYLLPDKIVFGGRSKYNKMPLAAVFHGVLIAASSVMLFVQLFLNKQPGAYGVWILYTLVYLLVALWIALNPLRLRALMREHGSFNKALVSLGAEPTWLAYAAICVIALMILGKPYFTL